MDRFSLRWTSKRGFSIVEILMSLTALSVILLATTTYFGKRYRDQKVLSLQAAKAHVINKMELAISDPYNIRASLEVMNGLNGPNNGTFLNCLIPGGNCPPQYLQANRMNQMDFLMPDGQGGYVPLTGFWSKDGVSGCNPPDAQNCPMQVKVYFWFTCENGRLQGNGSCDATSHAHLMYQIVPTSEQLARAMGMNLFHPTANALIPQPENFAYTVSVKELLQLFDKECLTVHYIDSYDNRGNTICRCLNNRPVTDGQGRISVDAQGRPLCQTNACRQQEILVGFRYDSNNNWIPICLGGAQKRSCYQINLQTTPECADNYWISRIDYGVCDITEEARQKKQASIRDVVCQSDSATCCTEYE